jgi:hypothetical protein
MIQINLMGGLGNQLFMIFAVVSYAMDYNIDYTLIPNKNGTVHGESSYWDNLLDCFKNKTRGISHYNYVFQEPFYNFQSLPKNLSENNTLINASYFQSYKYFAHNYEKIIQIMGLLQKQKNILYKYKFLFKSKTIAIHFRFGDYLSLQHFYRVTSYIYFVNAICSLANKLDDKGENIEDYQILYFCEPGNDIYVNQFLKNIKENIKYNINFIKIPDEVPDWTQLLIMSCCDHFIITNSSFSWFGAYFSDKRDKIVYRPKHWFAPQVTSINTKDLCPDEWITIDNT